MFPSTLKISIDFKISAQNWHTHIEAMHLPQANKSLMTGKPNVRVFWVAESEYRISFVELALVFEYCPPPPFLYIKYRNFGFQNYI